MTVPPMSSRRLVLPSLTALRSFECAARHGSFTLAAEELHLTQSAVSRQIRELELTVGTPLFHRIGRRVVLTEAGRSLAAELAVELENIKHILFRAVAVGSVGSSLRVATLPAFAARWLIPRLDDFERRHPGIEINLHARLEPFDLARERFDLAIHYGAEDWPGSRLEKLCEESVLAVASPALLERLRPERAGDLATAPLLHLESRPRAWAEWFHLSGIEVPPFLPGKRFDQFGMMIAAIDAGLGVGLVPEYLIEKELESGALVQALGPAMRSTDAYYLAHPQGADNPNARLFGAWLHGQVARRQRR
jgi:LysR family glycine cleavage system transcriptional activator